MSGKNVAAHPLEDALDRARLRVEQLRKALWREPGIECVGAQPRDAGHLRNRPHDVHGEALLRALFGDLESASILEGHDHDQRPTQGGSRLARLVAQPHPSGAGHVDHEVEPGALEVDELAEASASHDAQPAQSGRRRVERLQRGDRTHGHAGDDRSP